MEIAHRQGGPVSERIRNAPELLPGLQFYVDAFNLLTRSRFVSQGFVGRIPYGEISRFCADEDIYGDMREDVFYLLGEMDRFYVDWQTNFIKKKIEADSKANAPKTPPAKTRRR